MERFIGIIIEHFDGAFPVWLSPVQARIIPVADSHNEYAQSVKAKLAAQGIRAEADTSKGRMNKKIREGRDQRIPYMLIVGDRDIENGTVSVRLRTDEDLGAMPVGGFIDMAKHVIDHKLMSLQ